MDEGSKEYMVGAHVKGSFGEDVGNDVAWVQMPARCADCVHFYQTPEHNSSTTSQLDNITVF